MCEGYVDDQITDLKIYVCYCCVSNNLSQFCKREEIDSFVLYKLPVHTQDKQFLKTYGFSARCLVQSNNILSKY